MCLQPNRLLLWGPAAAAIDVSVKVGDDANYVYLFSHPIGDYPSDVPSSSDFFDTVIVSFETSE